MKKIGVLTSGGDAPGMNAAIRAVVHQAADCRLKVTGIKHGFAGLLERDFKELDLCAVDGIIQHGGTILRSARCDRFLTAAGQEQGVANLNEAELEGLVVIGGEGSFRGAAALARRGISVIGIPGTIDNDIPGTDISIGFDTAINTVVEAMNKIRDTASAHERTFVIEVMGRGSGHIALMAGLAGGAESILVPEIPFDLNDICQRLECSAARGKMHSIIVVAEGVTSVYSLGQEVKKRTGFDTRVIVLGHLQRGGVPTASDRILASRMGARAVESLLEGKKEVAICLEAGQLKAKTFSQLFSSRKKLDRSLYELAAILAL